MSEFVCPQDAQLCADRCPTGRMVREGVSRLTSPIKAESEKLICRRPNNVRVNQNKK